jgi:hypothetical protein
MKNAGILAHCTEGAALLQCDHAPACTSGRWGGANPLRAG